MGACPPCSNTPDGSARHTTEAVRPADVSWGVLCTASRLGYQTRLLPDVASFFECGWVVRLSESLPERLLSFVFASGLWKSGIARKWQSVGAGWLRLTARTGESLQGSGAGLLLSVVLTLSDRLGRFSDESFEEVVGLLAVPVAP